MTSSELTSCPASCQTRCRRDGRAWYGELMSRVSARDQQLSGVKALYHPYDEFVRNSWVAPGQGEPSEGAPGQGEPAASGYEASGAEAKLAHELKLNKQELGAAHTLLRERDEEVSEKERENLELKAQLQRTQDLLKLLQAKFPEAAGLDAEKQKLGESLEQA